MVGTITSAGVSAGTSAGTSAEALKSLSRRELSRVVERYPWFTPARRALALATGENDEALALALLFWPTVAPAPDVAVADVPTVAPAPVAEPVNTAAPTPTDVSAVASEEASASPPAACAADELIDRFISHGGYRIAPDGEAAQARVDVEIAPEMVSPRLAEIYRAQGLAAEAEKIEEILKRK